MMKMEIIEDETTYEGLRAVPAMIMGMMEGTGIRKMIDFECRKIDKGYYDLTPGMAVKAMAGAMADHGKKPLYLLEDYFSTAPVDIMFGKDVYHCSLSDTIFASRLDTIFRLDMKTVLLKAYNMLKEKYGFTSITSFTDASNYTLFGVNYEAQQAMYDADLVLNGITPKEAPKPAYGMNAKDGHNDRLQLNIHHIVDQNGIVMTSQSFDGNTSDIEMNKVMLKFISESVDMRKTIIVADCKLCIEEMVTGLYDSQVPFVTKVPISFNNKVRERVINSSYNGIMDQSQDHKDRFYYETHEEVNGRDMRFIAFVLKSSKAKSEEYIKSAGLKNFEKSMRSLGRRTFFCEKDAMDAFNTAMQEAEAPCYKAEAEVYEDIATAKRKKDGKPFRLRISGVGIDDSGLESAILAHAAQVLITDIRFSAEHSEDLLKEASADDVIDLYLQQYKAEAGFKMMKSGMHIGNVYIHTPARIAAIAFVVTLTTMLCAVANYVLKKKKEKGEGRQTIKALSDIHTNTLIWYDRRRDKMRITGKKGDTAQIFKFIERLEIDPKYMLTY